MYEIILYSHFSPREKIADSSTHSCWCEDFLTVNDYTNIMATIITLVKYMCYKKLLQYVIQCMSIGNRHTSY
jgi:hypothetical protein